MQNMRGPASAPQGEGSLEKALKLEIVVLNDRVRALEAALDAERRDTLRERRQRLSVQIDRVQVELSLCDVLLYLAKNVECPHRIQTEQRKMVLLAQRQALQEERASIDDEE